MSHNIAQCEMIRKSGRDRERILLEAASPSRWWIIVEGEGDAEGATNMGLLESSEDRKMALQELKKWRTRLVASTTDGPSMMVIHEGVQHVAVGRHEDRLEGLLLTMSDGRLQAHEAISVPHSGALSRNVVGGWHRLRAVLREHPVVGSQIALGLVGLPGCLLAAAGAAIIRRRRRRRGPTR